jgi:hypothetical protein
MAPVTELPRGALRLRVLFHYWIKRTWMEIDSAASISGDANEHQLLFGIHGLILALHYEARFLKNPGSIARAHAGFDNILKLYGTQDAPAARLPGKR